MFINKLIHNKIMLSIFDKKLPICDESYCKNITIILDKYYFLKKLQSNKYNIYQKIEMDKNIQYYKINILNGKLLDDWKFNITN
jgi:hypothetical protein